MLLRFINNPNSLQTHTLKSKLAIKICSVTEHTSSCFILNWHFVSFVSGETKLVFQGFSCAIDYFKIQGLFIKCISSILLSLVRQEPLISIKDVSHLGQKKTQ